MSTGLLESLFQGAVEHYWQQLPAELMQIARSTLLPAVLLVGVFAILVICIETAIRNNPFLQSMDRRRYR